MKILINDFENGGNIPEKFTCDDINQRPEIHIEEVSPNALSLVLHCEDKDSPGSPWSHWLMWNIDPKTEIILPTINPQGSIEGLTSFGGVGYGGPCPGNGEHRYYFRIYALDIKLNFTPESAWPEIDKAMLGHTLEYEEYMGKYERNAVYGEPSPIV